MFHSNYLPQFIKVYIRIDEDLHDVGQTDADIFHGTFSKKTEALLNTKIITSFNIVYLGIMLDEKEVKITKDNSREQRITITRSLNIYGLELCNPNKTLADQIENIRKEILSNEEIVNITLFGPSSVGKSCLINTFDYCLQKKLNYSVFGQLQIGDTGTKNMHITNLTKNIRLFDFPGYESEESNNKVNSDVNIFWTKRNISDLAIHNCKIIDGEPLASLKINEEKITDIDDQIHSVLFLWKPNFTGFFKH